MDNKLTAPRRLNVWGVSLLNKLKSVARNRVKREASKKRRRLMKKELDIR